MILPTHSLILLILLFLRLSLPPPLPERKV